MITQPAVPIGPKKSVFKKQMPTLLGLALLVVGLGVAAFLFSQGTGIFLPRATPETTPKNVRVSNVTEDGFYLTFLTDSETPGFVKYGEEKDKYTQIGDERDQLSGTVGNYQLHHIRVKGLKAGTNYFYVIGTGGGSLFDDNGEPFVIRTAAAAGTQPKVSNAYGTLKTDNGSPAEGWVVFITTEESGTQSSLVRDTGSWAVALSNARTRDGSGFAQIEEGDLLSIQVQGPNPNDKMESEATLEAEKSIDLIFGSQSGTDSQQNSDASGSTQPVAGAEELDEEELAQNSNASSSGQENESQTMVAGEEEPGNQSDTPASGSAEITTIKLAEVEETEQPVVETTQPKIEGTAPANLVITIEVNSDSQVNTQVTTDENGNFVVDIAALGANLEPGEHSIKYSYVDPATGQTVTKTQTFVVRPKATFAAPAQTTQSTSASTTGTQLAQAPPPPTPTPLPFGTNNPIPVGSPTPTPTTTPIPATPSATLTPTPISTGSATTSGNLIASGSVGTTALLLGGGLFFIISAVWSWWIARELQGKIA